MQMLLMAALPQHTDWIEPVCTVQRQSDLLPPRGGAVKTTFTVRAHRCQDKILILISSILTICA